MNSETWYRNFLKNHSNEELLERYEEVSKKVNRAKQSLEVMNLALQLMEQEIDLRKFN